ncbi:hypothetical protein [Coprobacter secundus]|uniref:hypothetical protein n=1 Tax=Coprobacter secundus TaxID=1501392 RepID=UPI00351FAAA1
MKTGTILFLSILILSAFSLRAGAVTIKNRGWRITYDEQAKSFDYDYKGLRIFANARPEATCDIPGIGTKTLTPASFATMQYTRNKVDDNFGKGTCHTFRFSGTSASVALVQKIYTYDKRPYILTEVELTGDAGISSNYLAPVVTETPVAWFPRSEQNRMLFVPWDNDGFIRYECHKLTGELTSYEVTSLYHGDSRKGVVLGSVEHDTWKSAVRVKSADNGTVEQLCCYSGASSDITRDKLPHGKVKGNSVKSAKMMLGVFDDWREGMNAYGEANTCVLPIRSTWTQGAPVGWNSWAVLANHLNYKAAADASDFFRNTLYPKGFHNRQGKVVLDLDSFWDNMSEDQLRQYVRKCEENGQIPGIYWCPFSYWGDNGDSYVEGTQNKYKYKDCFLYVNGKPHKQGGYCVDPTHPAIKERMAYQFKKFKEWGFKYVKLDFVTNGAVQGDSYYDKNVTTGTQAYNQGFSYLLGLAGDDMFLSLSIAPLFPYQYGNSRRISCDAWGTIGHSEYVMNALSYGWWTDKLFQYNDPDHIVLQKDGETEGENRARITTGVVTGMILLGDNFSTDEPSKTGNPKLSIERAVQLLDNKDILALASLERSFMPVYGYKSFRGTHYGAESVFMLRDGHHLYVACFNYGAEGDLSGSVSMEALDIDPRKVVSVKELWTGRSVAVENGELHYDIPGKDARIYRITLE